MLGSENCPLPPSGVNGRSGINLPASSDQVPRAHPPRGPRRAFPRGRIARHCPKHGCPRGSNGRRERTRSRHAAAPPPYRCAVRFLAWECCELDESSRRSANRKPVARRGATTNAGTGGSLRRTLLPGSMETADTSMFWWPRHTPAWVTGPASTCSSSTPGRRESRQRVAEGLRSPEDTTLIRNQRGAVGAAGSRR
jgi:hypothetical protein